MQTLEVNLGARSYPIYIGSNLLGVAELLSSHIKASEVMVVTNDVLASLYLPKVEEALAGFKVGAHILPEGEQYKNLDTVNGIFDSLLDAGHNRTTTVVALGGGVVGDITGFAAATYQRGVRFLQIPTTLLAQVDSSVGGKTGVNHPLGKNMIGAFYQPDCVVADVSTLTTLSDRDLSAGLAEVIKYGLIGDAPFLRWLEENVSALMQREPEAIIYAIKRSCQNKARVVAADEREAGVRATLNFGHTFGHAIECYLGYGNWLHGEAVATGMVMAADLSERMGWLEKGDKERICHLLECAHLPIKAPNTMTQEDFLNIMSLDKKVVDGKLRLVLLEALGKATVTTDFDFSKLEKTLTAS